MPPLRSLPYALALLTLGCVLGGCDGSSEEGPDEDFDGITRTDANGVVFDVDPDDWRTLCSGPQGFAVLHPAYPNPAARETTLRFDVSSPARVAITAKRRGGAEYEAFGEELLAGVHEVRWGPGAVSAPSGRYRLFLRAEGSGWACTSYGDVEFEG